MRTKKAVLKRFKLTKTGKILRGHQYGRHLRAAKSKSQRRRYKRLTTIGEGFKKVILTYLPHG